MHTLYFGYPHSYADSMVMYMEEEETRYLLPLKEYIAYCDSLRLACQPFTGSHHKYPFLQEVTASWTNC